MGIQGLLPLLKSIQQPISISELAGSTIGVDVYCWLHKGAYGCALQLAEGNDSDVYVKYVMRRVNMMLYYNVKPILVFDGGYLPSKSDKEAERRQRRKENKSQGLTYLKNGNRTQALECFQKSIDITPEMALNVMKACREKDVDYIVAPYEADAQLAYLMKTGITQFTISEDSDLLVYGCEKVIFKMDANGSGLMIDLRQLPKLKGIRMDDFTQQKFREMCILSGCDYLHSVKGMGLITAHKMLRKHSSVKKLISTLRLNTKMSVPNDYEVSFEKAERTFLYQIVFDPNSSTLVPLNPLPDEIQSDQLHFAGHSLKWKQEDALDLAVGNLNPLTGTRIGNFKLSKILSSTDEHQDNSSPEKKTKMKTSICPQVKKPKSSTSSTKKAYDAEKNLNGELRETKSSEKANSQFVTPVRNKRTRTKSGQDQQETSKLAKLYSTSMDEITVDVKFEINESETSVEPGRQIWTEAQPKLKIQRNNPFRSPVIRKPQAQKETVVSRYFGLAGMEVLKNETLLDTIDNMDKTNTGDEDKRNIPTETDSQGSGASSHEENSKEQDDGEFHESGYVSGSQTTENSPTNNPSSPNTPPSHHKSQPLPSTNFPPLPTLPTTPTSRVTKKRKNLRNKPVSSQMSLDKFAFKKSKTLTEESKTVETSAFVKRTVLANCSPPNYKLDEKCNEKSRHNEPENEDKKENCINFFEDNIDEVEEPPCWIEENAKVKNEYDDYAMARTQPKLLGLRSKPTTGLGRCRAVGLGHPRKNKNDNKTKDNLLPLLNYFAYQRS